MSDGDHRGIDCCDLSADDRLEAKDEMRDRDRAVIRQMGFEGESFEVVLTGGMFNAGDRLIQPLRESSTQCGRRRRNKKPVAKNSATPQSASKIQPAMGFSSRSKVAAPKPKKAASISKQTIQVPKRQRDCRICKGRLGKLRRWAKW